MPANPHPKKNHPKKEIASPNVSAGAINAVNDYFEWFKNLEPEAQQQINSDAAQLVKTIRHG